MRLMRTVARRVALSLSEAKRFTILNESFAPAFVSPLQYQYVLRNIFAPIPVAAGAAAGASYSRIGSEIVDPLLKLKWTYFVNIGSIFATNTYYGPIYLHTYLVAANDAAQFPLSSAVVYPDGISGDPGWILQTNPSRPTLNGNNVKVLKARHQKISISDFVGAISPDTQPSVIATGIKSVTGSMSYRWKRKLTYEDVSPLVAPNPASGNQLRGWNYYILTGWGINNGTLSNSVRPSMLIDSFLYFKDP